MNGYNFTERVRKVLSMAREAAVQRDHEYVGTEHILLGLIHEGSGVGAAVLRDLGVDLEGVVKTIDATLKRGKGPGTGPDLPYTSRAKKVLELSMSEARELGHSYVGTEHLLLGLIREEKGIAAQVLSASNVTLNHARTETLRLLRSDADEKSTSRSRPGPPSETTRPIMGWPSRGALAPVHDIESLPPSAWATNRAQAVIDRARADAVNRHSRQIEPEHLLIALLEETGGMAVTLMEQLRTDRTALQRAAAGAVEETLATDEPLELEVPYSQSAEAVLRHAFYAARSSGDPRVGTDHLLLGLLLEENAPASRVLHDAQLSAEVVSAQRSRIVG